ncbi:UNVERIFIED_CONTAM: hypothetical protein HDU68_001194 [Siphonaria sp. JEL0065]|nr:hypothetical protein HDU68_001194 [Siphonaria sp. JEL0065]
MLSQQPIDDSVVNGSTNDLDDAVSNFTEIDSEENATGGNRICEPLSHNVTHDDIGFDEMSDFSNDGEDQFYVDQGYTALGDEEDENDNNDDPYNSTKDVDPEQLPPAPVLEVKPEDLIAQHDIDIIRAVMGTFSLSERAIPDWAKHIPEEQWLPKVAVVTKSKENIDEKSEEPTPPR